MSAPDLLSACSRWRWISAARSLPYFVVAAAWASASTARTRAARAEAERVLHIPAGHESDRERFARYSRRSSPAGAARADSCVVDPETMPGCAERYTGGREPE
jgi:hypothetical protein